MRRIFLVCLLALASCGKYDPPLAPEVVSPARVGELQVTASQAGVTFQWKSPENDRQGKQLKSLSGYAVERKVLTKKSDMVDSSIEFDQVTFIEDHSVEKLIEARDAARAAGTPVHRAKVDAELKKFSYVDSGVTPGVGYLYRIVPINVNGKGEVGQLARVLFRGDSSEIAILDNSLLEDDLLEDPFS